MCPDTLYLVFPTLCLLVALSDTNRKVTQTQTQTPTLIESDFNCFKKYTQDTLSLTCWLNGKSKRLFKVPGFPFLFYLIRKQQQLLAKRSNQRNKLLYESISVNTTFLVEYVASKIHIFLKLQL